VLGPSEGGLGGLDAPDGFPASGCNAYPSGANAFFADAGATFTIAEPRSRSVTRSGRAYNCPSGEPADDTPEPTTQEPTPGPTPGSADTPARTSHLLPGDLDTDSDEDHNLTAEELIQREAQRLEE